MSLKDLKKNATDGLMSVVSKRFSEDIHCVQTVEAKLLREQKFDYLYYFHKELKDIFDEYCLGDTPKFNNKPEQEIVKRFMALNSYSITTIQYIYTAFIKSKELELMLEFHNKIGDLCIRYLNDERLSQELAPTEEANEAEEEPLETHPISD